ncbi:hypothetical protein Bbelb_442070 [Branchiostoma belcheri]|nr:hypothetical protein Bbelb_442070 [Branchiostoma belcheri]
MFARQTKFKDKVILIEASNTRLGDLRLSQISAASFPVDGVHNKGRSGASESHYVSPVTCRAGLGEAVMSHRLHARHLPRSSTPPNTCGSVTNKAAIAPPGPCLRKFSPISLRCFTSNRSLHGKHQGRTTPPSQVGGQSRLASPEGDVKWQVRWLNEFPGRQAQLYTTDVSERNGSAAVPNFNASCQGRCEIRLKWPVASTHPHLPRMERAREDQDY